eukprot:GHVS01005367.1.p1 GENE.GHVS01005367.1~~GHVS01005367.1.p1  ORF type:complete len:499 (+),score=83.83 GHVS01005367.1:290-1786(+)
MSTMSTIKELYAISYAPLQGTLLSSPTPPADVSQQQLLKELAFLLSFTSVGIKRYDAYLEERKDDGKSEEIGVSLYCLGDFLSRVQELTGAVSNMAGELLQQGYTGTAGTLRDISSSIKEDGFVIESEDVGRLLNVSEGAQWSTPAAARGKVLFRSFVSMVRETKDQPQTTGKSALKKESPDSNTRFDVQQRSRSRKATGYPKAKNVAPSEDEDDISEVGREGQAVVFPDTSGEATEGDGEENKKTTTSTNCDDVAENKREGCGGTRSIRFEDTAEPDEQKPIVVRKQQRKATGFHAPRSKGLEEDEDESDDETTKTGQAVRQDEALENKTSGQQSVGESSLAKTGSTNNGHRGVHHREDLRKRSRENSGSIQRDIGAISTPLDTNSFLCCRACGNADNHELVIDEQPLTRRSSSVGIGEAVDIEDSEADDHWRDQPRHDGRIERIRKRRPTGHPLKMKLSGEELDMLDMLASSVDQDGDDESTQARELPTTATDTST